jgi:hypothetical protein
MYVNVKWTYDMSHGEEKFLGLHYPVGDVVIFVAKVSALSHVSYRVGASFGSSV